ncbi:MAG: hypothetical protein IJM34_03050 [Lachnospiraceae bacterium]|nr:hypothetical protein [Lachnospiraceae bacterium]
MEADQKTVKEKLLGKWYEQCENGAVLTVEERTLIYEKYGEKKTASYALMQDPDSKSDWILCVNDIPDSFTTFVYHTSVNPEYCHLTTRMNMVVYDMHYSPRCFEREPYEAPKYGEVHINTNEKAIKWFQDYRVRKLCLKVQVPFKESSGMMAPMPPYNGYYTFDIERTQDGGGIIKAVMDKGGCAPGSLDTNMSGGMMMMMAGMQQRGFKVPDVEISPEDMNKLALCIANGKLDQLNGLDAWQDGVPAAAESFDLSIQFYKESYHARANHIFVPKEWKKDGYKLHLFILNLLVKAGLDYGRMEFHSTKPMLRIVSKRDNDAYGIYLSQEGGDKETVTLKGEVYDYDVEYPAGRWKTFGEVPEALKNSLDLWMEQVNKEEKARGLWLYDAMAKVPEDKRTGMCHAARLLGDFRAKYGKGFFWFLMLRGEVYYVPIEGGLQNADPYGDHKTYCFSTKDGHQMSVAEFYTDTEKLIDLLIKKLSGRYSHGPMHDKLVSPEYREILRKRLTMPETLGGMGFEMNADSMSINFQCDLDEKREPWISETKIHYEDSQDILNPEYAEMKTAENKMPYYGNMLM